MLSSLIAATAAPLKAVEENGKSFFFFFLHVLDVTYCSRTS